MTRFHRSSFAIVLLGLLATSTVEGAPVPAGSAPLRVSVTVVRSCAVNTGAASITVVCANGVSRVAIDGHGLATRGGSVDSGRSLRIDRVRPSATLESTRSPAASVAAISRISIDF